MSGERPRARRLVLFAISIEVTPGWLPFNSKVRCSSQSGADGGPFSRSLSDVVPPVLIAGFRTFTVKVRVSYLPGVVSTFSSIRRRDSASWHHVFGSQLSFGFASGTRGGALSLPFERMLLPNKPRAEGWRHER